MKTFPVLRTKRLTLRKIQVEDLPSLVKYANNKKVADNIVNMPHPYREPDAAFRIKAVLDGFKTQSHYVFSIILKERQEFIGEISLHIEKPKESAQLAYWIGEAFWNKGITSEAAGAVLRFGFETLDLDSIQASCYTDNPASAKVLEHNGMSKKYQTGNLLQHSMTKEEYSLL